MIYKLTKKDKIPTKNKIKKYSLFFYLYLKYDPKKKI